MKIFYLMQINLLVCENRLNPAKVVFKKKSFIINADEAVALGAPYHAAFVSNEMFKLCFYFYLYILFLTAVWAHWRFSVWKQCSSKTPSKTCRSSIRAWSRTRRNRRRWSLQFDLASAKSVLIAGAAVGDRDSPVWAPAAAPAIDTDFSEFGLAMAKNYFLKYARYDFRINWEINFQVIRILKQKKLLKSDDYFSQKSNLTFLRNFFFKRFERNYLEK